MRCCDHASGTTSTNPATCARNGWIRDFDINGVGSPKPSGVSVSFRLENNKRIVRPLICLINETIRDLYLALRARGQAHSLEIREDGALVGGVYGVTLGAAFFGESMFSRRTNASKMALACLVDRLRDAGFQLFDTQFLTAHLASLGAVEITRAQYRSLLFSAIEEDADFAAAPLRSPQEVVQRMTQIS